jgi:heat shock protein HslJ
MVHVLTDCNTTVNYNPQTNEIGELAVGFEGEANPSSMNLTMKKWEWVKTTMNDGKVTTPKKAGVFSVTFGKDNMVHVLTDCNTMNGSYSASNKSLAFKQMASTMMYCEGSQEQDFAQALNEVSSYFFTSKGELILELKMDSGTITFK